MKLLFCDHSDIFRPWGSLRFGASAFRHAAAPSLPFSPGYCERRADGSYDVIGHHHQSTAAWQIYRATTPDGITFDDVRVVHDAPGTDWGDDAVCLHSPELGRYIYTKAGSGSMNIFHSEDGESWQAYAGNPVFREHKPWGGIWTPALRKFVLIQKGIQRIEGKKVNETFLDAIRVLTVRTSDDGFTWTPSYAPSWGTDREEVRNMRILHARLLSPDYQLGPNQLDPPEMELYDGSPYPYEGRFFMLVNNYSGSFTPPEFSPVRLDAHGPLNSLGFELWTSRDGLTWERPAPLGGAGGGHRSHNPMLIDDRIIFRGADSIATIPADRLTYVTAQSNGYFDTAAMVMGAGGLFLNLRVPGERWPNDRNQAYVMCELLDDTDRPFPGYDRERCVLQAPIDRVDWPLRWDGNDASELAGERARLRIYLRESNVYALTSPDGTSDADTMATSYAAVSPRPH